MNKILILQSTKNELNCIKVILQQQGRSQTWLANQLSCTFTTVNGWCNNRHQPPLEELIKMAELLGVAPADLIIDGRKTKGRNEDSSLS